MGRTPRHFHGPFSPVVIGRRTVGWTLLAINVLIMAPALFFSLATGHWRAMGVLCTINLLGWAILLGLYRLGSMLYWHLVWKFEDAEDAKAAETRLLPSPTATKE